MKTSPARHRRVACALLCAALAGCAKSATTPAATRASLDNVLREAREHFTCGGKPIHPGVVYEFIPWLSDRGPVTVAVELLPAQKSNRYSELAVRNRAGWIECEVNSLLPHCRHNEPSWETPMFGYRGLGSLADGTQVLRAYYCAGGSGKFHDLVFIRFEPEKTLDDDGKPCTRLLMKALCVFPLGDRDDAQIRVLSDRVIVGRSKYRDKEIVLKLE